MTHYLIKITDNSLCTVIVFSLFCALAALTSRKGERGFIPFGAALGVAVALVYAILKRTTGIAVREYYDLGVMLPALFLLPASLAALWRPPGEEAEVGRSVRLLSALLLAALAAHALPNLMLYPFEFAVGMESIFNTEFLYRVTGFGLGLLLMALLGFSVFRISAKLPRGLLRALLLIACLVLFAKFSLEAAQILVARNWVPRAPWLLSLVIFVLNHANGFAFVLMALAAFSAAVLARRTAREPLRGENPALRRKQRAEHRSRYGHAACVLVCLAFAALTITEIRARENEEVELSPPLEIASADGEIRIPIETVSDGNLHRFQHRTAQGVLVRYIVIKKSESAYGVGLDACDICGPSGYYQRKKGQIVCKLCDVVINISTIGFPGGCNPVPLRFNIARGRMVILAKDLDAEQDRFQGHAAYTPVPENGALARRLEEWGAGVEGHCSGHEHPET